MNFIDILKEYFGWTCIREPEGWLSWQHLLLVFIFVGCAIFLGIYFGLKKKEEIFQDKIKPLKVAAILIDSLEILKILIYSFQSGFDIILSNLPLFLCSLQLISLPIAAFSRGKLQQAAIDFCFIFGLFGCLLGTILGSNIYSNSPILSFPPMVSCATHAIAGFGSVYIGFSGLKELNLKNTKFTYLILLSFEVLAIITNAILWDTEYESNYMFLSNSAGTPLTIVENIVNNNQYLYTIFVALLYALYLTLFVLVYNLIARKKSKA